MEVHNHKVNTSLENLKEVPFTNNSKLVPLASMTLIHPVVRKLFTEEIPNVPLETYLSLVKGYQILKKIKSKVSRQIHLFLASFRKLLLSWSRLK